MFLKPPSWPRAGLADPPWRRPPREHVSSSPGSVWKMLPGRRPHSHHRRALRGLRKPGLPMALPPGPPFPRTLDHPPPASPEPQLETRQGAPDLWGLNLVPSTLLFLPLRTLLGTTGSRTLRLGTDSRLLSPCPASTARRPESSAVRCPQPPPCRCLSPAQYWGPKLWAPVAPSRHLPPPSSRVQLPVCCPSSSADCDPREGGHARWAPCSTTSTGAQ